MLNLLVIVLGVLALVIVVLVGLIALVKRRGAENKEIDYRIFFVLGLAWMPAGVVGFLMGNYAMAGMLAIGIVFFIVGAAKRDQWKENGWSDLSDAQKRGTWILLGVVALSGLALLGWVLSRSGL